MFGIPFRSSQKYVGCKRYTAVLFEQMFDTLQRISNGNLKDSPECWRRRSKTMERIIYLTENSA